MGLDLNKMKAKLAALKGTVVVDIYLEATRRRADYPYSADRRW